MFRLGGFRCEKDRNETFHTRVWYLLHNLFYFFFARGGERFWLLIKSTKLILALQKDIGRVGFLGKPNFFTKGFRNILGSLRRFANCMIGMDVPWLLLTFAEFCENTDFLFDKIHEFLSFSWFNIHLISMNGSILFEIYCVANGLTSRFCLHSERVHSQIYDHKT